MIAAARLPTVQRVALALVQWGLVLPLVTVRSCHGTETRTVTGVGHYFLSDALPLGVVLAAITLVLFVAPWRGDRSPLGVVALGLRAWAAAVAAVIALGSPLFVLFETAVPRVGYYWHGGGQALLSLGYLGLTARLARALPRAPVDRPVAAGWGVVALALSPPLAVALGWMANARGPAPMGPGKALGLLLCTAALAAPLALGGVGLVRAQQSGQADRRRSVVWWMAVAFTLVSTFALGLDG